MENVRPKVKVQDVLTKQVLFECEVQEMEKAYQFAAEMEEMGLDIEIVAPTLGETLSSSLGLSKEAQTEYQKSLEEEMDSHEGSCCFTNDDDKIVH